MGFSVKFSFGKEAGSPLIRAPKSLRMEVISKLTWHGLADMYAVNAAGEGPAPRLKEDIRMIELPSAPRGALIKAFDAVGRFYRGDESRARSSARVGLYVDTDDEARRSEVTAKLGRIFKGWPGVVVLQNAPGVSPQ